MGTGSARFADTCLTLAGLLSAGNFFSELEVRRGASGLEFIRNSQPVTLFPDRLSIDILTLTWKCGGADAQETNIAKAVLDKIHFQVGWKTGMRIRPVKKWSVTLRPLSAEEWKKRTSIKNLELLGIPDQDFPVSGAWVFELVVTDEQIPLTDSLTVVALEESGKQVSRFTARLA